jgi:diketogulonate reductase-like aldo/keto reductase
MDLTSAVKLNSGYGMPCLGLGVFRSKDGEETYNAVRWALEAGYRHIDTAAAYGNEASVGRAIRDSGIPRDQIFLTTKLWNGEIRAHNEEAAFAQSLKNLGTGYVDLYLVHWPVREEQGYLRVWEKMERFHKEGRARSIGVSNYHVHHLEDLLKTASVLPAVNQVECHPLLTQVELADYCASKGIAFEPWSPLGAGKLLTHPTLTQIAQRHGKTVAQVILRWDLQRGFICIPKSVHKERIQSNTQLFDFALTEEEMQRIFSLNADERVGADPETFTF